MKLAMRMSQDGAKISAGRIATIPPQSVQSCELVIEALARELDDIKDLLGDALEAYIHEWNTPDVVRRSCPYWQRWNNACRLLDELREDWPHLGV